MSVQSNRGSASILVIMMLSISIPYVVSKWGIWLSIFPCFALLFWILFEYRQGLFKDNKAFLGLNFLVLMSVSYLSITFSNSDNKFSIIVVTMIASLTCVLNNWLFVKKDE